MTDRSLLFSKPMILALNSDRKTKTRRLDVEHWRDVPAGTRIWVREAWRAPKSLDAYSGKKIGEKALEAGYPKPWAPIKYEADGALSSQEEWRNFGSLPGEATPGRHRHGRFMPRWASRLTLIVEGVKAERLRDISEQDAIAEGIRRSPHGNSDQWISYPEGSSAAGWTDPRRSFQSLWGSIHGDDSWAANSWVAAIAFRVIKANIDTFAKEMA